MDIDTVELNFITQGAREKEREKENVCHRSFWSQLRSSGTLAQEKAILFHRKWLSWESFSFAREHAEVGFNYWSINIVKWKDLGLINHVVSLVAFMFPFLSWQLHLFNDIAFTIINQPCFAHLPVSHSLTQHQSSSSSLLLSTWRVVSFFFRFTVGYTSVSIDYNFGHLICTHLCIVLIFHSGQTFLFDFDWLGDLFFPTVKIKYIHA